MKGPVREPDSQHSGYSGFGDEKSGLRNDEIAGSGKMAFLSLLFKGQLFSERRFELRE